MPPQPTCRIRGCHRRTGSRSPPKVGNSGRAHAKWTAVRHRPGRDRGRGSRRWLLAALPVRRASMWSCSAPQRKECLRRVGCPPPRHPVVTLSPRADHAAGAQECRHFLDTGCSPRARGARLKSFSSGWLSLWLFTWPIRYPFVFSCLIKDLADCGPASNSTLGSGERYPESKREPVHIQAGGGRTRSRDGLIPEQIVRWF